MSTILIEFDNLPDKWVLKPLGELVSPNRPRIKPEEKPKLPFLGMDHIEPHTMRQLGSVPAGTMKSSSVHFQSGDVLYGRLRPYLNKVFQTNFEGLCSAEFIVFPQGDELHNKYLQYFLNWSNFVSFSNSLNSGDRPRVKFEQIAPCEVPVPPFEQQKRIVAKIEELFSHIDAGIEALNQAKQLLKQYRQSVLKAAVTGELTKEWREQNKSKLEPASQLLECILKERRQKWEEQQLAQFKAKGKIPNNDKWKEKYKEPQIPNLEHHELIPASWEFCGLEMILPSDKAAMKTGPFGSLLKKSEHTEIGVPVLGIENIASMQFIEGSKIHVTEQKAVDLVGYRVEEGDIIISRSGTVGEVCVVPNIGEARISTNLMKLSIVKKSMHPVFFTYIFNGSPFVLGQVSELCKGSTRLFLNQDILKKLLFMLPPYLEQLEIVSIVEEEFSAIERLRVAIDIQLLKADRSKQSILASAFSGRLV